MRKYRNHSTIESFIGSDEAVSSKKKAINKLAFQDTWRTVIPEYGGLHKSQSAQSFSLTRKKRFEKEPGNPNLVGMIQSSESTRMIKSPLRRVFRNGEVVTTNSTSRENTILSEDKLDQELERIVSNSSKRRSEMSKTFWQSQALTPVLESPRRVKTKPEHYSQIHCLPGTVLTPKPPERSQSVETNLKRSLLTTFEMENLIDSAIGQKSSVDILHETLKFIKKK